MDEDHGPTSITPETTPSQRHPFRRRVRSLRRTFTTRDGLLGAYDYAALFRPNLPCFSFPCFSRSKSAASASAAGDSRSSIATSSRIPFFGLNDRIPVLLAVLLGFQHALAMLAGVITPPIILSGPGGVNFTGEQQQYLVSTALIVSGILSSIQITRLRIYKTP